MPKPILEVTLKEWAATRDKLFSIVAKKTADENLLNDEKPETETGSLSRFKARVKDARNLDLSRLTPARPDSLDAVIREINVLRNIIDDIDAYLDDDEDAPGIM